jgi:hypothetical protein
MKRSRKRSTRPPSRATLNDATTTAPRNPIDERPRMRVMFQEI